MKSSKIYLNLYQVNQFAVFGFNSNYQILEESEIYVSINYSILTGALLCLECDIIIKQSNLKFLANGLQISALILKSKDIIQIENVNISYRFSCDSSSGIVNQILNDIITFLIDNVILTGYNDISSQYNGYLSSKVDVDIKIQINVMFICVDMATQRIGSTLNTINISSLELLQCNQVCDDYQFVIYGLCQEMIQFSVLLSNNTVICDHPFEFDQFSNTCVCKNGYYLNDTVCVNIISKVSLIITDMQLYDSKLQTEIYNTQIALKSLFNNLETEIQHNISNLFDIAVVSYTDLKQLIISTNNSLQENLNVLQSNVQLQFKLISDQNLISQAMITSFKSDTQNNFSAILTLLDNNQLNIKNNFTQTNFLITNLNTSMKSNFDLVITDVQNINLNIKNNFTQTNQKIDTVNAQIGAVVTNSNFQTQIDLLKEQIQNISVSISQSMTSNQYRCLIMAAYIGSFDARDNYASHQQYLFDMTYYGCPFQQWW
ncbi:Growth_factor receptor cysteine-rich domain superfamily [Hexamita inflata]|uniref:Growth_factor receptor cysteine-rich domain superfamily n=1 Tax=Hexamita inflata TaxID=28002 RepID=A0ABP1HIR0_9EUKA